MEFKTDIQIAQECEMKKITEIAKAAGVAEEYLELYGNYKAKVDYRLLRENKNADGKLILVTAINPKFEMYVDKKGEFRFRLKARNGQIIATSEGYVAKDGCLNGIESVRKNAPDAEIVKE